MNGTRSKGICMYLGFSFPRLYSTSTTVCTLSQYLLYIQNGKSSPKRKKIYPYYIYVAPSYIHMYDMYAHKYDPRSSQVFQHFHPTLWLFSKIKVVGFSPFFALLVFIPFQYLRYLQFVSFLFSSLFSLRISFAAAQYLVVYINSIMGNSRTLVA